MAGVPCGVRCAVCGTVLAYAPVRVCVCAVLRWRMAPAECHVVLCSPRAWYGARRRLVLSWRRIVLSLVAPFGSELATFGTELAPFGAQGTITWSCSRLSASASAPPPPAPAPAPPAPPPHALSRGLTC
eukprot:932134-Rhodomonas_salina.1